MSRLPLTLGVAAGVVLLDQVTKFIAVARLEGEPPIQVIGEWLQLTFVRNSGAAFSLAGNYTIVISVLAIVVAVAIVRTARTLTAPFRGHVVDFLELPNWPVFNVADMALVGSAILAVVLSFTGVEMGAREPVDGQDEAVDPEPGEADPGQTRTDG